MGEQIGSSTPIPTAQNVSKRASTALNGAAAMQVIGEVAGQGLARRPFTREGSTALNGAEPHRIAAAHESFQGLTCKDSTSGDCLRVGSRVGADL
jgi:hypothetical protein